MKKYYKNLLVAHFSDDFHNVHFTNCNAHASGLSIQQHAVRASHSNVKCVPHSRDIVILQAKDFILYEIIIPKSLRRTAHIKSLVANFLEKNFPRDISLIEYSYKIFETAHARQIIVIVVYKELIRALHGQNSKMRVTTFALLAKKICVTANMSVAFVWDDAVETCMFIDGMLSLYSYHCIDEHVLGECKIVLNNKEHKDRYVGLAGIKFALPSRVDVSVSGEYDIDYRSKDFSRILTTKMHRDRYELFRTKFRIGKIPTVVYSLVLFCMMTVLVISNEGLVANNAENNYVELVLAETQKKLELEKTVQYALMQEAERIYGRDANKYFALLSHLSRLSGFKDGAFDFGRENVQKEAKSAVSNSMQANTLVHAQDEEFVLRAVQFRANIVTLELEAKNALELFYNIERTGYFSKVELQNIVQNGKSQLCVIRGYLDE